MSNKLNNEIFILEINFQISISDIINFQIYHILNNQFNEKKEKLKHSLIRFLFPINIMSLVYLICVLFEKNKYIVNIGSFLLVFLFIISIVAIIKYNYSTYKHKIIESLKKQLKARFSKNLNLKYQGDKKILFFKKYVEIKSDFEYTKTFYDIINEYIFTEDYLYIYDSSVSALIIPRRFIDEQQKIEIEKILDEKIESFKKIHKQ